MRSISMEEQSEEINKSGERMTFPPNVTIFSIFVTRNARSSLVDTPQPIESSGDNFEYSFRLSSTPSVNDVTKRLTDSVVAYGTNTTTSKRIYSMESARSNGIENTPNIVLRVQ